MNTQKITWGKTIYLYEDNGGNLFIGDGENWFDVTGVQEQSSFAEDASCIVDSPRDLRDWTVPFYTDENLVDGAAKIAVYEEGAVTVSGYPGNAGRSYLRLPEDI